MEYFRFRQQSNGKNDEKSSTFELPYFQTNPFRSFQIHLVLQYIDPLYKRVHGWSPLIAVFAGRLARNPLHPHDADLLVESKLPALESAGSQRKYTDMSETWVISHVPMFHITQPLGINGLLDGYYFR